MTSRNTHTAARPQERPVRGQFMRDVAAASTLSESERDLTTRVGLLPLDGDEDLEVR